MAELPRAEALHVSAIKDGSARWTWFELDDARRLDPMHGPWQLLVDQARFSRIGVEVTTRDGNTHRLELGSNQLAGSAAPGGSMRFPVAWSGIDIRRLRVGFRDLDHPSLMRKINALDLAGYADFCSRWLLVIGLFTGLLVSAFIYNLFISIGGKQPFSRWYMAWCATALTYGLVWTGAASAFVPWLVGPPAVRFDYVLVGSVVGLASLFLLSVLPQRFVPLMLKRGVRVSAVTSIGLGVLAANEHLFSAIFTDKVLNVALAITVAFTLTTLAIAIRRGSRTAVLLLLGWTPMILVFLARLARNFGIVPQSDLIDQATFVSMGIESLMFSLAIANRFRMLQVEWNKSAEEVAAVRIETDALRRAARSDFLTGLGNRAAFQEQIQQLLDEEQEFKLALIDIDNMKFVNDRFGHTAGDALLQHVAATLAPLVGPGVTVNRVGGDEFAVLVVRDDLCELHLTATIARLQGQNWQHGGARTKISLSIGEAPSTSGNTSDLLFKFADLALYEAKNRGRGRLQQFDDTMRKAIERKTELREAAKIGIPRGEFRLFYQPILSMQTRQCIGAEALLRWDHPSSGLLTPSSFFELFEHKEIGPALQQFVLDRALGELRRAGSLSHCLSVNFTAMDLNGVASANRLLRHLAHYGIDPGALCIEVTEGVLLGRASSEPQTALTMLHQAGVKIALDDFGTGYASLVHLMQVPFDVLKIDQSFVSGLAQGSRESEQIIKAVIAMGQGLGKKVIAEGIETEEQFRKLAQLGCHGGQGYLLGRPDSVPPWSRTSEEVLQVRAVA